MATLKKGDFVEIEYTGKVKDSNSVFDTTDENTAKINGIYSKHMHYGPVIICIGESDVVKGLDKHLEGKETDKSYTIELKPEEAFGRKNARLIQLIPTTKFYDNQIDPFLGLQVNIDGMLGIIKHISGGRTLVDFNHPLSGREVIYEVKLNKIVIDEKEKVASILDFILGKAKAEVTLKDKTAQIKTEKEINPQLQIVIKTKIKKTLGLEAEFAKAVPPPAKQ